MQKSYERIVDPQGRLVIAVPIWNELEIEEGQELELTIEYGKICIKKYEQRNIEQVPYVGLVRKVDNLRRVVIPREYMKVCGIEVGMELELSLVGKKIEISIA